MALSTSRTAQARRQDLAAGEGAKTRMGGLIFKILYWMYGATRGPNVKWEGHRFQRGGRAPLHPPAGDGPGRATRQVCTATSAATSPLLEKNETYANCDRTARQNAQI